MGGPPGEIGVKGETVSQIVLIKLCQVFNAFGSLRLKDNNKG